MKTAKARTSAYYKRERKILIACFLVIPLTLLVMFTVYPVCAMIYYSFTNWNGYGSPDEFVGLKNYVEIFTNPKYWVVFQNSLYYLVSGLIQQALGLALAVLLSRKLRLSSFFKGTIFFPYLINAVAVSFIFLMFYEKGGVLDSTLQMLGLSDWSRLWIADPNTVKYSLAFTALWRGFGYSFVIYSGAMQSVPSEIYEAAEIDGANAMQRTFRITIPNIKMVIGLMLMMTIIGSLSVFDIPFIMTKAQNGTNTFISTVVDVAFTYNQFGLASALSVVLLIMITLIALVRSVVLKEGD